MQKLESILNAKMTAPSSSGHHLSEGRANSTLYDSYYRNMDKTQAQKVAFSTAHIPPTGALVFDMGFGTGAGTYDLSQLYPNNTIVGVDIDPHAITHATQHYAATNLHFVQADISANTFPKGCADVIFNSSIIHEVLSYASWQRFDLVHLRNLLDAQVSMLKPGAKYIIRDFIKAPWPRYVQLDMRTDDGKESGETQTLSSNALFLDFIKRFSCKDFQQGEIESAVFCKGTPQEGWIRYLLPATIAQEFMLRRQYTNRWDDELQEAYTYCTQAEFEQEFTQRGLRLINAQEIHNPWIQHNWFEGTFKIYDLAGNKLPFPPTNFIIIGENVPLTEGVVLRERASTRVDTSSYLQISSYIRTDAPALPATEVVTRPGQSTDYLAYYVDQENNNLHVLVKSGYPRPILNSVHKSPALDNAHTAGYTIETINAASMENPHQNALTTFCSRAGLDRDEIDLAAKPAPMERFEQLEYFPSPGTSDESIQVRYIPLKGKPLIQQPQSPYSSFSTSGDIRGIDSRQLLRAFQVGGMHDSRLEINLYRLHRGLSLPVGAWIGATPSSELQALPSNFTISDASALLEKKRAVYTEASQKLKHKSFFEIYTGEFEELNQQGKLLADRRLEYVIPKNLSTNTGIVIPYARLSDAGKEEIIIFLEERDFAAVQKKTGSSALVTLPGFRLDPRTTTVPDMVAEVGARSFMDFGITFKQPPVCLGSHYYPSIGFSPETAYLMAGEVDMSSMATSPKQTSLVPVRLSDLLAHDHLITDAHLLTGLYRLAHMRGLI